MQFVEQLKWGKLPRGNKEEGCEGGLVIHIGGFNKDE